MRPEYLFVRILEACNADCFMCGFALSRDLYRISPDDFRSFLPRVKSEGIRCVRLTGGEPLMHAGIVDILAAIREHGLKSSIITNGALLERKLHSLVRAGLDQVIVSIDGSSAAMHDGIRGTRGLFERAVSGLRAAAAAGLFCRVNTVCGPSNFRDMPALQDLLTELGVRQWELSSLKLERKLPYTDRDIDDVAAVIRYVYEDAKAAGRLVPMGKIWCGDTEAERERYFSTGVTPRADRKCLVVEKVRYLDAKGGMLFPCSLLPHRPEASDIGVHVPELARLSVHGHEIARQSEYFSAVGPDRCTGCSTTAAGWNEALLAREDDAPTEDWSY